MSANKLYYFSSPGRAEIFRLIFAATGGKYEDIRYESNRGPSHTAEMHLDQMPVLECNGVKLPQLMSKIS